jgi:hypothetical protein
MSNYLSLVLSYVEDYLVVVAIANKVSKAIARFNRIA